MPLYEYQCESCGTVFEKLENINSEAREAECPQCGKTARRKISLSSYQLNGSGFHNTDYKSKPKAECPAAGQGSCCAGCAAANK